MNKVIIFNLSEQNSVVSNKIFRLENFYISNNFNCDDFNYYYKAQIFRNSPRFDLIYFFVRGLLIWLSSFFVLFTNNYRIVFVSVGPFYLGIICLHKIFFRKTKFILDVRDPWIYGFNENKPEVILSSRVKILHNIFRSFEKLTFLLSDFVIYTNEELLKIVIKNVAPNQYSKFHIIKNGYNVKIPLYNRTELKSSCELVVFGKFSEYSETNTQLLIEALKSSKLPFTLNHFNKSEDNVLKIGLGVGKYIFRGSVDYKLGLKLVSKNRIALINESDMFSCGTKVYDYIMLNIPIICICPVGSEISKLVNSFTNGFVCHNSIDVLKSLKSVIDNNIYYLDLNLKVNEYSRGVEFEKNRAILLA
jgi:hypothetical protein